MCACFHLENQQRLWVIELLHMAVSDYTGCLNLIIAQCEVNVEQTTVITADY